MAHSAFRHSRSALYESLSLFLERRRPNADQHSQSLTHSLFARSTLDHEIRVSQALRQPVAVAQSLLASNRLYNSRFEHRRNVVERPALVELYSQGFELPQREDYLKLVGEDQRSRILVSFHCGDFLFGSANLLRLEARARKQYVLSINRASNACYRNLASGFGDEAPGPECELLHGQTCSQKLSQLLRAGDTSILLFCDVPPGLNETTEVNFLNRRAWFSIGPAVLALANRVPLLPLLNFSQGNRSYIILGPQIEPVLLSSETLRLAATRITQSVVSFFETLFLGYPEQWRFLSLLPMYFVGPAGCKATHH